MIEIIAEAGIAHNGNVDTALRMVEAALMARANIVKFQTFDPDKLLRPGDESYAVLSAVILTRPDTVRIARYCDEIGIEFLSTPGDPESLKFLVEEAGVQRIKIGSDDLTYRALIESAAKTELPMILSTGMATMNEIELAIPIGHEDITLLHCVSSYPTALSDANLKAIQTLDWHFPEYTIGYSDHVPGTRACLAAAALGAQMIEKHFMMEDNSVCLDKEVSISASALCEMVNDIRAIEKMLGGGVKAPCMAELANVHKFRKGPDGRRGLPRDSARDNPG